MAISQAQFDVLVHALIQVGSLNAPADALLKQFFRDRKALGPRDRTLVAESIYAGLRRSRWLEQLVPGGEPRRLAFAVLGALRGYSMRELEPLCRGSELEWLQAMRARAPETGDLGLQAELPDWVIERLRHQFDDDTILALGRAMQQPAPLDLRVNTLKADREEVQAQLAAAGIETVPMRLAPAGLRAKGKPALAALPVFKDGLVEVQDEGSQLLGYLLAPRRGEMVVDFCAGAGGKTLLLGALLRQARIDIEMGPQLRLLPHLHGTDGFFAAAWRRRPAGGVSTDRKTS
jgi:16S rRNA (cytosine967-C5)-methyltransferase